MKHLKTFEQFVQNPAEETNEGVLDFVKGIKKYKLTDLKLTPTAEKEFKIRKKAVEQIKNDLASSKLGLTPEQIDKAVIAIFNFLDGTAPIISKYNIDYDKAKDELVINPNGKGLFAGHPVMG